VAGCGQVLAISPDGNRVVIADNVSQPNQVYIYDNAHPANGLVDLLIGGATAAAFSPDEMKLFILTNSGTMYVYSSVDALASVPIAASATAVAFSADGSFAYVAGGTAGSSLSAFATCDLANLGSVSGASVPLTISPLPNVQVTSSNATQNVLALVPPYLETFTATFNQNPLQSPTQLTCNAPTLSGFVAQPNLLNLGQGAFTPLYMGVAGNNDQVIVVAKNIPAVLVADLSAGTTTAFPLLNSNGTPESASASTDGSQIFVAACDVFQNGACVSGSVHIVNILQGGDIQDVSYTNSSTNNSMCNNLPQTYCFPNLIAVKPQ